MRNYIMIKRDYLNNINSLTPSPLPFMKRIYFLTSCVHLGVGNEELKQAHFRKKKEQCIWSLFIHRYKNLKLTLLHYHAANLNLLCFT